MINFKCLGKFDCMILGSFLLALEWIKDNNMTLSNMYNFGWGRNTNSLNKNDPFLHFSGMVKEFGGWHNMVNERVGRVAPPEDWIK